MDSWMGHSKQELLMKWGMPTRESSDGNGGQIVMYAYESYIPGYFNVWDYKMFYINASGNIYYWRTQQQAVPPTQVDLNVYSR